MGSHKIGPQIDARYFAVVEIFLAAKNRKRDGMGKRRLLIEMLRSLSSHCLLGLLGEGERKGSASYCLPFPEMSSVSSAVARYATWQLSKRERRRNRTHHHLLKRPAFRRIGQLPSLSFRQLLNLKNCMQYEARHVVSYCEDVVLPSQWSEVEGRVSLILNGYFKVDAQ